MAPSFPLPGRGGCPRGWSSGDRCPRGVSSGGCPGEVGAALGGVRERQPGGGFGVLLGVGTPAGERVAAWVSSAIGASSKRGIIKPQPAKARGQKAPALCTVAGQGGTFGVSTGR